MSSCVPASAYHLDGVTVGDFVVPVRWGWTHSNLKAFRLFLCVYWAVVDWVFGAIVFNDFDCVDEAPYRVNGRLKCNAGAKELIYLTNWVSKYLFTAYLFFTLYLSLKYESLGSQNTAPPLVRVAYVMRNILLPSTLAVALLYWGLIGLVTSHNNYEMSVVEAIHAHGGSWILMMVDLAMLQVPLLMAHVWHSMVFGCIYILFTALYYAAGMKDPHGYTAIYRGSVDWDEPVLTLGTCVVAIFIVLPLCHYGIVKCYSKLHRERLSSVIPTVRRHPAQARQEADPALALPEMDESIEFVRSHSDDHHPVDSLDEKA